MSEELSPGVRIIIERCKSNPDEFAGVNGKWSSVIVPILDHIENGGGGHQRLRGLRKDEIQAMYDAIMEICRQDFDSWVMKKVLDPEPMNPFENTPQIFKTRPSNGVLSAGGVGWTDPLMNTSSTSIYDPASIRNAIATQGGGGSVSVEQTEPVLKKFAHILMGNK